MQPILSLRDVSYSYHNLKGETPALSHINLQISEGSFVAVVGPSGCGKSTLLSIIAGLLAPEDGEVIYRGLSSKDYCADSALKIGYMLQRDHLFEWRTVYRNVILGLELTHSLTKENTDYVLKLLEDYGLYGFKDKKPSELSGGMRQRAALIRTMAVHPDLLLLDEPFSALDFQTRLSVSADPRSLRSHHAGRPGDRPLQTSRRCQTGNGNPLRNKPGRSSGCPRHRRLSNIL